MRTLLIADDERNIRLGLRSMIERECPGGYRILLAADGEEAAALLEREPADIVITDIRMPKLDGLELIRRMAGQPSARPETIILSGYDDFEYAREAIKHNVKEYLLKPIVREELFGALRRAEADLARSESLQGRLRETERVREALRVNTLNYVLAAPALDEAEIARRCAEAGLQEFEPAYCVAAVDYAGHQRERVAVADFLRRAAREAGGKLFGLEDRDGHGVFVSDRPELFERLAAPEAGESAGAGVLAIGLSGPGSAIGGIRARYEEAKEALKHSLLLGAARPALIRHAEVRDRRRDLPSPAEDAGRLAVMLGTGRENEMKAILRRLFEPERIREAHISYLDEVSRCLNELVFDEAFRRYGEASVDILRMYREAASPYRFGSLHDYIRCVENLLLGLSDYAARLKTAHVEHREMARAVAFIEENYDKDLNMAIVSNHVSLNYSYFSECFKEYTGEHFVHYLKKVRIGKAKELLETTGDKVYEIARKVGFDNPKQFNRVFRELVGVSALEYRQQRESGRKAPR